MRSTFNRSVNFVAHFPTAILLYAGSFTLGVCSQRIKENLQEQGAEKLRRSLSSEDVGIGDVALAAVQVVSSAVAATPVAIGIGYVDEALNVGIACSSMGMSTAARGVIGAVAAGTATTALVRIPMDRLIERMNALQRSNQILTETVHRLLRDSRNRTNELAARTDTITEILQAIQSRRNNRETEATGTIFQLRQELQETRRAARDAHTEINRLHEELQREQQNSTRLSEELQKLGAALEQSTDATEETAEPAEKVSETTRLNAELARSQNMVTSLSRALQESQAQLETALEAYNIAVTRANEATATLPRTNMHRLMPPTYNDDVSSEAENSTNDDSDSETESNTTTPRT